MWEPRSGRCPAQGRTPQSMLEAFDNLGGEVRHKYEQVDTKLGNGIKYTN